MTEVYADNFICDRLMDIEFTQIIVTVIFIAWDYKISTGPGPQNGFWMAFFNVVFNLSQFGCPKLMVQIDRQLF